MPQPVMPGVVGAPQQRSAEDVEAEIVKMREQLARYGFGIEFFAAQQFVKITLLHQSIADLAPPAFYLPVNVLLKVAGQILSSLDIGR
jgi:hypothetical protein